MHTKPHTSILTYLLARARARAHAHTNVWINMQGRTKSTSSRPCWTKWTLTTLTIRKTNPSYTSQPTIWSPRWVCVWVCGSYIPHIFKSATSLPLAPTPKCLWRFAPIDDDATDLNSEVSYLNKRSIIFIFHALTNQGSPTRTHARLHTTCPHTQNTHKT